MDKKEILVIELMKNYDFELVENEVELLIFEKEYRGSLNLGYTDRIVFNRTYKVVTFNRTYKVVTFTIDGEVATLNMEELKLIYAACSYLGWLKEGE